jgi:hypothetical protein
MSKSNITTRKKIQMLTIFFMVALVVSGVSAIPVQTEIQWLLTVVPEEWTNIHAWLLRISDQLGKIDGTILYGFDWLAFAHICIAACFYGILKDPVRNIWVVEFAIFCCFLIIPFALIAGPARNIPFWWQLIDCSFGIFGIIPLYILRKWILQLEKQINLQAI